MNIKSFKHIITSVYFVTAIWLLFFFPFTHASRLNPDAQRYITLTPFKNTFHYIQNAWQHPDSRNLLELLANVGGNIMLFVPFGIILFNIGVQNRPKAFLTGLLCSFIIESLQILTYVGNFDVDDIIWNTTGTLIGFVVWQEWVNRTQRTAICH